MGVAGPARALGRSTDRVERMAAMVQQSIPGRRERDVTTRADEQLNA